MALKKANILQHSKSFLSDTPQSMSEYGSESTILKCIPSCGSIFLQARGTDWRIVPVMCLRFSDWPISIHNSVYIFHLALADPYSDIPYS